MKSILITGGAGSIGSNLLFRLIHNIKVQNMSSWYYDKIIIMDNDEYGLSLLEEKIGESNPIVKLALGDIRDRHRLRYLLRGVDAVVHCSAYKRVEVAEHNVSEVIRVNIEGTLNLVEECQNANIKKILLISSDKAVPYKDICTYGITKLMQERMVLLSNNHTIQCSVVRFGNVIGTKGDVLDIWTRQFLEGKPLSITNKDMKRYFWSMEEAVNFIIKCLSYMKGGEIFIPKMQEYNIMDYAKMKFGDNVKFKIIGLRSGETMKHKLMTEEEQNHVEDLGWCYRIRGKSFEGVKTGI